MNLLITGTYTRGSMHCFDDKVFHYGKKILEFWLYRIVINKDISHTIAVKNVLNEVFEKENIPVKVFRKNARLYLRNNKGYAQEISGTIEIDYQGGVHGVTWRGE